MARSTKLLWLPVVFAPLLVSSACSGSEDAGTGGASSGGAAGSGGGSGGAPSCPPKASDCPSGCNPVNATPIDLANDCLGEPATVACYLGTGGEHATIGCIKDVETKTTYRIPSVSAEAPLFGTGEWLPCPSGWMDVNEQCP